MKETVHGAVLELDRAEMEAVFGGRSWLYYVAYAWGRFRCANQLPSSVYVDAKVGPIPN